MREMKNCKKDKERRGINVKFLHGTIAVAQ